LGAQHSMQACTVTCCNDWMRQFAGRDLYICYEVYCSAQNFSAMQHKSEVRTVAVVSFWNYGPYTL
jgi:hypothetical protein